MSDNQEKNKGIIDSYDGDPDDLVFFRTPEEDMEEEADFEEAVIYESEETDLEEAVIYESEETDLKEEVLYESEEAKKEQEERDFQKFAAEYGETIKIENMQTGDSDSQAGGFNSTGIDLTDPHYANYTPDPYYDYGYGPEPREKKIDDKKDGTTLGVVSLSAGIGANLMCCCGFSYVLSFVAIITGICCLCMKNTGKDAKVMSVIGIVIALLPFVLMLINLLVPVFTGFSDLLLDNI